MNRRFKQAPFIRLSRLCIVLCLIIISGGILLACFYYSNLLSNQESNKEVDRAAKIQDNSYDSAQFIEPVELQMILDERIVHLDLKGAPPKVSYFEKLFPLLKQMGATGVLLEYEDMFPYDGDILGNISALNAYDLDDIHDINTLAKETNLKIIPLIQTFGHLEFVLKLEQFKQLREVENNPQVICPSHVNTLKIIEDMIDQIVQAHPDIEMLHIGCDEVFYLGYCQKCTSQMSTESISKNGLFLKHLNSIAQIINHKYPKLKVLMWDDMFRNMPEEELMEIRLSENLTPVVWRYSQNVFDDLGPSLWTLYSKVFKNVWIASAFKGATGIDTYMPDSHHYVVNHKSWLSLIAEHKHEIHFQGIFLTGWQRYDHFSVLCELLPVGMPALGMCLRLLRGFQDSPIDPPKEVASILQCSQPFGLIGTAFGTPKCKFPGGDVLENILLFHQLVEEYNRFKQDSRVKGYMNDYNVNHKFSSRSYVESVSQNLGKIQSELMELQLDLEAAMEDLYDRYTVNEWMETYFQPFVAEVNKMWEAQETLLAADAWPRRPLDYGIKNTEF